MYCLDCGTKVEEGSEFCPNCGMTVAKMRERIDHAVEMVTYAETIGPDATTKLPPVKARRFVAKDGSKIDPAKPVESPSEDKASLGDIPTIGSGDPYLTMPIPKIVDDNGKVAFDSDTAPKIYSQPETKMFNPVPLLISLNLILLLAVGMLAYLLWSR